MSGLMLPPEQRTVLTNPESLKAYGDTHKSVDVLLPALERHLLTRPEEHRDGTVLHPSALSKSQWCPRKETYDFEVGPGDPEHFSLTTLNIFENGHAMHAKYQRWLAEMGVLWGKWRCQLCSATQWGLSRDLELCACGADMRFWEYREVPLAAPELMLGGHADGVVVLDRPDGSTSVKLLEIKTLSPGTIRVLAPTLHKPYADKEITINQLWMGINKPFSDHVRQALLYFYMAARWNLLPGRYIIPYVDEIIFIYEWKPTNQIKEFRVRFNMTYIEHILNGARAVTQYMFGNAARPAHPVWATQGKRQDEKECKACPHRNACWGISASAAPVTIARTNASRQLARPSVV